MTASPAYTQGWAVPGIDPDHALCVLDRDAPPPQWRECRTTGIGGSDVSGIFGLSKWATPFHVWVNKTDPPHDDTVTEGPRHWGNLLEPVVRDEFARLTNLTVTVPGTLRSVRWPWMTCNLDGLVSDGCIYEGKTVRDYGAREWEDGQVADHAELQAQHNMAVTGTPGCHVACLIGGSNLVIRYVDRDDALIETIVEHERRFWHDYVLPRQEPPVDHSSAATQALTERYGVADEGVRTIHSDTRRKLHAMLDQAAAAATYAEVGDQAKNWMRQLMGENTELHSVVDGTEVPVATWRQTGAFSEKKFREAHPELHAQYLHKVEKFNTKLMAAEHPELYTQFRSRTLLVKDSD